MNADNHRPTPLTHLRHAQNCWCLNDSECCRPDCTCHDTPTDWAAFAREWLDERR